MSKIPDEPDEVDDIDPAEIESASEDLVGGVVGEPEIDERTENLTAWDEPPTSTGGSVPKVGMEDEISPVEQLVEEGLEEADRDQRMAAADPDFEP